MNWDTVWQNFLNWLPDAGIALGKFLLVIILGIIFERVATYLFRKVLYKTKMDTAVISFILSITKVAIKVGIAILALGALNLNVTALTASLGMFGVALSVALKDTLSSIANGLNIIVNKPFKNGDYVDVGNYSGTVSGIKMMSTEIITPDNKSIIIPNNMVNTSAVINYSSQENRRLDIEMEVAYGTDVELVKDAMYETVKANNKVNSDPAVRILLDSYGSSSIVFKARFWVKTEDYWDVYWDVKENMVKAFNKYGIQIPFNQMDVHIDNIVKDETSYPKPKKRPLVTAEKKEEKEDNGDKPKIKKIDKILNERFTKNLRKEETKRQKALNKKIPAKITKDDVEDKLLNLDDVEREIEKEA